MYSESSPLYLSIPDSGSKKSIHCAHILLKSAWNCLSFRSSSPSITVPGIGDDLSINIGSSPCPAEKSSTEIQTSCT
ncbi:hypothetical protein DPMN_181533 [Dreissena polymorpha]|uniref:Uncharacterized protein n=1 Tax=Dreissena polymorpha TaxID=45954 RepID=A0A9D4DDY0_DREPO|nr:hypothetical protein DPMN_181533 [Dreissena polymorpha]